MQIDIPDKLIQKMVQEEVDTSVRKRIKEMQGDYMSKGFVEKIIQDVIWNKVIELCPNIEYYIKDEVERCIKFSFKNEKLTKIQLVEQVIDGLFEKYNS